MKSPSLLPQVLQCEWPRSPDLEPRAPWRGLIRLYGEGSSSPKWRVGGEHLRPERTPAADSPTRPPFCAVTSTCDLRKPQDVTPTCLSALGALFRAAAAQPDTSGCSDNCADKKDVTACACEYGIALGFCRNSEASPISDTPQPLQFYGMPTWTTRPK